MAVKGPSSRQGTSPLSFVVFPLAGVLLANLGHLLLLQEPVAVRSGWGWSNPAPRPQPRPAPSPSPNPSIQSSGSSSSPKSAGSNYESTVASRKPKDTVEDDATNGATPRISKPFWRSFFLFPLLGFLVVHLGPLLGLMKEPSLQSVHSGWGWSAGGDDEKKQATKQTTKQEKQETTETSNAAALVGKSFFLSTWPMAWWRMMT